jgi:hypothetical protein
VTRQTPAEAEREREEDEANAGCFLQTLGYAGEGCLWAAIPCVAALVWVLS